MLLDLLRDVFADNKKMLIKQNSNSAKICKMLLVQFHCWKVQRTGSFSVELEVSPGMLIGI